MSKEPDFGIAQYRRLFPGAVAAALASQFISILPGLVVGNLFGETALGAFQVVSPWLNGISFLLVLVSSGAALNYGEAMGAFDRARCRAVFSGGFIVSVLLGVLLAVAASLTAAHASPGGDLSDEMASCLNASWRGFAWVFLILPLSAYLKTMICADGDSLLAAVSVVGELAVSAISMVLFGRIWGVYGAWIGLALGTGVGLILAMFHFLRENNSFRLGFVFAPREVFAGCAREFPEASSQLIFAVMSFVATMVWRERFGAASLGVVSVVFWLDAIFVESAFATAALPLVNVYLGERNTVAVRSVLRAASRGSFIVGGVFCLVIELFPEQILRLYGITTPELLALGVPSLRIAALNFPLVGFVAILVGYYQVLRRPVISQLLVFCQRGILPIGAMVLLTPFMGIYGFWLGYALMCAGALVLLYVLLVGGREGTGGFPFLLSEDPAVTIRTWSVPATEEGAVCVSKAIFDYLRARNEASSMIVRAAMLAEEAVMSVRERNPKRRVLVEVMLRLGEHAEMILRDDGRIFNLSESAEDPTSLRAYVLDSMLCTSERRDEIVTTGFNRRVYSINDPNEEE